ncbi:hypothetical protein Agub_g7284, partial [Astrephomene gubernaculifera]
SSAATSPPSTADAASSTNTGSSNDSSTSGSSFQAALTAYRIRAGLHVDPEQEQRAAQLYDEGMELFKSGELRSAYDKFVQVLALVPVKSKQAILLDSAGQGQEAQRLYRSVAGHSVAQVSKKARQMLFGFEAMTFMKADQFSYGVKKAEYDKYFRYGSMANVLGQTG